MSAFGEKLKEYRETKGFTQSQLARASKLPQSYLSALERGEKANPSAEKVARLESALELTAGTLGQLLASDVPAFREPVRVVTVREGDFTLPLLGTVPAGVPAEPMSESEPWDFGAHLGGPGRFLLRVRGVSMVGAGIHDSDLVIVEPCRDLDKMSGRVVVATVDGNDTVKRLARHGKRWTLEAYHQDYPAITLTANNNAGVVGLVVGLVRLYS